MAIKSAEERIDSLERALWWYRLLFVAALLLVLASQRYRVVGWIDKVESWASATGSRD